MRAGACLVLILAGCRGEVPEAPRSPVPVVIDTDIGDNADDAFALAFALASPELDVRAITTVGTEPQMRARMVARFLAAIGRKGVTVAAGLPVGTLQERPGPFQYAAHPDAAYNRTQKIEKESAVEVLYRKLKEEPGLTILSLGPPANIARLLADHPDCRPWIRRIVLPKATPGDLTDEGIAVKTSGVPLSFALDSIGPLETARRERIFAARNLLTYQLRVLWDLSERQGPGLSETGLVAHAAARGQVQEALERSLVEYRGRPAPARPTVNGSELIDRGRLPARVHAVENFETDIERRWWLSGVLETKNLPPGSARACRGVLTHDFDDKMGAKYEQMYTAVVFNPVPGPPMGKNTRLSFRYRLKGTDGLRVQLYTLSKGYHRHLTLKGLPQGRWESAAVDMTAMRRPDGTGGPLSEDERIDDIQFYTDPEAELFIDDIVLYDAAAPEEKEPFPARIHFTGGFDTGKQGAEWPGTFDIVAKEKPLSWKAARSVKDLLRVHLRGERPLGERTRLSFRYRIAGTSMISVELSNSRLKDSRRVELKDLAPSEWREVRVDFPGGLPSADEVRFLLPAGAELTVDDLLLYEPG